jgi:hypothetical protein
MTVPSPFAPCAPGHLQQLFVRHFLPRIERHGAVRFRHVRCPALKQELLAELRGLCWQWFLRLVERNRDALALASTLADFAARAVRSGRRVCGHERARDVLSPVAQRRHGFAVRRLPTQSTLTGTPLAEALCDNTRTPPDEQAQFRCDFPAWRASRSERDRRLIDDLMLGERTGAVARGFGLSPGRVSQLRREFHEDWARFCGEADTAARC